MSANIFNLGDLSDFEEIERQWHEIPWVIQDADHLKRDWRDAAQIHHFVLEEKGIGLGVNSTADWNSSALEQPKWKETNEDCFSVALVVAIVL